MTGPEFFDSAVSHLNDARENSYPNSGHEDSLLRFATIYASLAQTAASVMQSAILADVHGSVHYELEAWREVIPVLPLTECRSKHVRRPECAKRHTEDCDYADPVPEPKHELLPVGTRVLFHDLVWNEETQKPERSNPKVGKIAGYDMSRSKYQINEECYGRPGEYYDFTVWAFADNRVQVHPGDAPIPPKPENPRIYVQNQYGKQGHVTEVATRDGVLRFRIQWYVPGVEPVWKTVDSFSIIPADQVARCPNGQTGDECGSGENQCEPCLQAEDDEGDEIEESMGLR